MNRVRTQATAAGWTGRNDTTKERELEERYYATGRRKTAVARVWLT